MSERLNVFRKTIEDHNLDAMLITNPINRQYLSSFDGSSGMLLVSKDNAYLVTDFRYIEQATAQAKEFEVKRWKDNLYEELGALIKEKSWGKLGFESKHVVYSVYNDMKDKISVELIPVEDAVKNQRMVKSSSEQDILRRGAKILDQAFNYICSIIKPGMSEADLALELEIFLRRQGAEKPSFQFIVASGVRGAMPHGTASDKIMQQGELVTIDYGGVFEGYATDMTRTVALGKPGQKAREIYKLVLEGQQKASRAVKPFLKACEVDAVARGIFEKAGYGQYFGHGLGHGIGLETHEFPVLNQHSKTVLEAGMAVTVEPGIYIPQWGGVRIEDMVIITDHGPELLTNSPHELVII